MPAPAPAKPSRQQPLWVRVDENRVKLAVFVALFVTGSAALLTLALVLVPGWLLGWGAETADLVDASVWYARLPWVVLAAFVVMLLGGALIAAVQLANAEDWVRNRFSGKPLGDEAPGFESVVGDMALAAGLPEPPRLLVLEEEGVNAFALGTARKRAVIGVTRGLLAALSPDEQRAVAAVLIARVVAGDIMFGTALASLMGPLKAIRESRTALAGCAASGADATTASGCADGCADLRGCGDGCSGCADAFGDDDSGCLGIAAGVIFIAVVVALTYVAVVTAAWIVTAWGRMLQNTSYEKADAEGMLLLKEPAPMLSALRRVVTSSNAVGEGDPSYDGIFYAPTSGRAAIERVERRRFERLREVLGIEGIATGLPEDGGGV